MTRPPSLFGRSASMGLVRLILYRATFCVGATASTDKFLFRGVLVVSQFFKNKITVAVRSSHILVIGWKEAYGNRVYSIRIMHNNHWFTVSDYRSPV